MDARLITNLLLQRHTWSHRDTWSRQQLLAHQQSELAKLRSFAVSKSPLYRRWHDGYEHAPLSALPPMTKVDLMNHWDEAVTDSRLSLSKVSDWLKTATAAGEAALPYDGAWFAARTGGTSGHPGIFAWNRHEWADVITSYARANDWAGIKAGLMHPLRTALVSSHDPTHQSNAVGASLASPLVPTLRLDAGDPIGQQTQAIEEFRPRLLVGYASAMRVLAEARARGEMSAVQLDGVVSASEVLTTTARNVIEHAWNVPVIDVYAATETAGIASPCTFGNRHVYEDLIIAEPVDDNYQPVPPGVTGSQLLVTVLFARTLPLIRYVMDDRVAIGQSGCPCGRPHATLPTVEGRSEDVLSLPNRAGYPVQIPPIVLHHALDDAAAGSWQVEWDGTSISVNVTAANADPETVKLALARELDERGIAIPINVIPMEQLPRTRLGKLRLVVDSSGPPS